MPQSECSSGAAQRSVCEMPASTRIPLPSSPPVLLFARRARELHTLVKRFDGSVLNWVLVLKEVDASAHALKRRLDARSGSTCLLIHADFHDPADRSQALARAELFAGRLTCIVDGTSWQA